MNNYERVQQNMAAEIQRDNQRTAREEATRREIEENDRTEQERRRRELNNDPALVAARERIDREQREREAEAKVLATAEKQVLRDKARAELDAEKQRRLDLWTINGGDPDDFELVWAGLEAEILMEKQAAIDKARAESSVF